MNELDEIQAFFAQQLRSRRALPNDAAVSEQAQRVVKASGRLSAVERLEIYREQFWLRHTASLAEDFPGVRGIVGQSAWATLVEGYLAAYPPQSFTLRDLGGRFPDHIAGQSVLPQLRLCTDMARLELAYIEIFDAADVPPITPETLSAIPESAWQAARLVIHPALRLLQVEYRVAPLRRQLIEAQSQHQPSQDAHEHAVLAERDPHCLLVFRRDLQLFQERISRGAHALLGALTRRVPLLSACEQAQLEVPDQAAEIAESIGPWFQAWAARGLVTGVEV